MIRLPAPLAFTRWGAERVAREQGPPAGPAVGRGRVALVTGANSGIGFATASALAEAEHTVWLLCRDAGRGQAAREAIVTARPSARVEVAEVDVASMDSIRRFARDFRGDRVDVLVHNAGAIEPRLVLDERGVERTFATAVVGPYLLTALLSEQLERARGRVVFVSSGGAYLAKLSLSETFTPETYDGLKAYARAKRGQIALASGLAAHYASRGVLFASMHPGWVDTTALTRGLPAFHGLLRGALRTPAQGADTIVWLATSDEAERAPNGSFWFDRRVASPHVFPWTRGRPDHGAELVEACAALSGERIAPTSA